jgi:DNA polymerase I-like protein with 3'-5' exonuclease and polymerase domains
MNELFHNPELESKMMSKFEVLFDRHTTGNITHKAADMYLSIMEEHGIELDIETIVNLAEEYDLVLENFEEEIEENM